MAGREADSPDPAPPPRGPPPRQVPQVGTCLCSNFLPGTWLFYEQRHLQGKALTQPGLRLGVQSRASGMPAEGCRQGQPRKAASHLSHLSHLPRPRPCPPDQPTSQAPPLPSRPAHTTGPAPALQAPPLPSRPQAHSPMPRPYLCRARGSCICTLPRHRYMCPGSDTGWTRTR